MDRPADPNGRDVRLALGMDSDAPDVEVARAIRQIEDLDDLYDGPAFDEDALHRRDLRLAFGLPRDAPDSDVDAAIRRMSAAGYRVVNGDLIERELAAAVRMAAYVLAEQVRRIADVLEEMPDEDVITNRADILRHALVPTTAHTET